MKKQILFLIPFLISLILSAQEIPVPKLSKRVTDLTGTLSNAEINVLESKLKALENSKGSQLAVLLVKTTGDETIEQFGIRVVDQWKLGRENVDDGILLLFAMNDRKMRIEVGYGLEGAVTDALSKRIITNVITPEFRAGHFYNGIDNGIDILISAVKGEELPPVVKRKNTSTKAPSYGVVFIAFGVVIAIVAIAILNTFASKKYGSTKANLVTGVVSFLLGWVVFNLFTGIMIALFSSFLWSRGGGGRGGRGGYYGGGFYGGGGGFSGGGGFGGFSGGGGGFGGGGASGGW